LAKIEILTVAAAATTAAIMVSFARKSLRSQADEAGGRVARLDELMQVARLAGPGHYDVRILRQSRVIHSTHEVTGDPSAAIELAISTLQGARVHAVNIHINTDREFRISRVSPDRSMRSANKIGWVIICHVD
jgi:hypothetical protein